MAATFTATPGYKGQITADGDSLKFIGTPTISGVERTPIEITALYDGFAPFRSFIVGLYGPVEVSGQLALDTSNDGVTEVLAHFNAGTTTDLIYYDENGGNTLLSGTSYVVRSNPVHDLEGQQLLDVTLRWSGSLTGALVDGAA